MQATVISRIERLDLEEFVGMSVSGVREQFGQVLGIPSDATPMVNAHRQSEDYILEEGDELIFQRLVGEKG